MLYAKISRAGGAWTEENIYLDWNEYHKDTFNPESSALVLLPFEISGKSYAERKEAARNLAIDFQAANDGDADINLSYHELSLVGNYFLRVGRKYGLLREFRENCIPC